MTYIENADQLGYEIIAKVAESRRKLERYLKVWAYVQKNGISESDREAQILFNLTPDEREEFLAEKNRELQELAQSQVDGSDAPVPPSAPDAPSDPSEPFPDQAPSVQDSLTFIDAEPGGVPGAPPSPE